ncbi:ABC transporter ATP-binding protein [Phytohabitans kaempferiae]|uniref:ABC transporter ATP-binding protein n=1 Tax=Phytohabitans kaempferiae TaxID=1620943 RepID=A0ABV6MHN8_9ACTN
MYGKTPVLTGVTFDIGAGEAVGLVGTSGAGKSTIARCLAGQEHPTRGTIAFDGTPIRRTPRHAVQIVFQDPRTSLNPRWTVRRCLREPAHNFRLPEPGGDLLTQVGLDPALLDRYPHELSTGQCQRVCIARALVPDPRLLVLDEPLSALDLPAQAQILDLLRAIRHDRGLAYLFISHDITVVTALCDRVLVLDGGRVIEHAQAADLLTRPQHPHTRQLIADTPRLRYPLG